MYLGCDAQRVASIKAELNATAIRPPSAARTQARCPAWQDNAASREAATQTDHEPARAAFPWQSNTKISYHKEKNSNLERRIRMSTDNVPSELQPIATPEVPTPEISTKVPEKAAALSDIDLRVQQLAAELQADPTELPPPVEPPKAPELSGIELRLKQIEEYQRKCASGTAIDSRPISGARTRI